MSPRRPITAVEREAWGLMTRPWHTLNEREWMDIQARLAGAFEPGPLDHLNEDPGTRFQGVGK